MDRLRLTVFGANQQAVASWVVHFTDEGDMFVVWAPPGTDELLRNARAFAETGRNQMLGEVQVGRATRGIVDFFEASAADRDEFEAMRLRAGLVTRWRLRGPHQLLSLATDPARGRSYTTTTLPTLEAESERAQLTRNEFQLLSAMYGEVCASWRTLTDVRFKLLALVPAISGLALADLFSEGGIVRSDSRLVRAAFCVFGLLVTLGLRVYDLRNSDLYDDLISRGRKLEEELGVRTGHFRGRLKATWPIQHDAAIALIYGTAIIAWLAASAVVLLFP